MSRLVRALLLLPLADLAEACTCLAAGKKATVDGSVLLTHSDDSEARGDPRFCYVPPADHAPGSQRPIYWDTEDYPRFVGSGRGTCYAPKAGEKPYEPIGSIPQVPHTFGYYEQTYGALNEHGVGIGESTCSGMFGANATGHGGNALLSIDTMSQIAMERSKTAREAVQLIGSLAEKYGFYGIGSFEGTAESLFIGDPEEVFIFHILPDPTGLSAIWAAQRVPDDHVAVVANMFVIRNIDFQDSQNFLYSESVKTVAEAKGWWKPGTPLDFTKVYSNGEYAHKFYSGRRMWGAFRRMSVTGLPDDYSDLRYDAVYPVTAKPSAQMTPKAFFEVHRDYYDGSKYDMHVGLAAGPWSDPDRWGTQPQVTGNWERSISLFRTTTTHVVQSRRDGQGPVVWFGPHNTASTCFIPLLAKGTTVPAAFQIGDPTALSRQSAYWAFRYVFNVAKIKYSYAMKDVQALQTQLEQEGLELVARLDAEADRLTAVDVEAAMASHAAKVVESFWQLADNLIQNYSDGWLKDGSVPGYPEWWLKAVGYQNGPPPVPSLAAKGCSDDEVESCLRGCASGAGFAKCAGLCTTRCVVAAANAEAKAAPFLV